MDMQQIGAWIVIAVLTILSGVGDAQGFLHASKVWVDGRIVLTELVKSALGFGAGILIYWVVLRFLSAIAIVPPEVQTLGWFVATIVGVAVVSGNFSQWMTIDKIVVVGTLAGIGWLLYRTAG